MNWQSAESQCKREIKSYVLRSRMTSSQQLGLEKFWASYGVEVDSQELDFSTLFHRAAPTILEIGFGMGASLVELAKKNPTFNFLGVEVHKPGIGSMLAKIEEQGIRNLRVICKDALQVLKDNISDSSLFGALLFFPDPWPKRRHQKRRIVQPSFVQLIHEKLMPKGYFHLATDISGYAAHMSRVINNYPGFSIINGWGALPNSLERPKTKFEQRGERLGHSITDLIFSKKPL